MKNISYRIGGLRQERTLFNQARNDTFDQRNLRVFKTLKAPAVEFEAENALLGIEGSLDHLQEARFSGAPITMHADSYREFWFLPQQRNDCFGNRLIVEEINLSLIV